MAQGKRPDGEFCKDQFFLEVDSHTAMHCTLLFWPVLVTLYLKVVGGGGREEEEGKGREGREEEKEGDGGMKRGKGGRGGKDGKRR